MKSALGICECAGLLTEVLSYYIGNRLTDVVVSGAGLELGDVRDSLELLEEDREAFPAKRIAAVDDHVSVAVRKYVTPLVLLPRHLVTIVYQCLVLTLGLGSANCLGYLGNVPWGITHRIPY